jgi:hypothetical protein
MRKYTRETIPLKGRTPPSPRKKIVRIRKEAIKLKIFNWAFSITTHPYIFFSAISAHTKHKEYKDSI